MRETSASAVKGTLRGAWTIRKWRFTPDANRLTKRSSELKKGNT
jgi:hypothetical protein